MRGNRTFPLPESCEKSTLCVSSKGDTPERRKEMKRIEIKDQLRNRLALELTDRQMAEADKEYAAVKGAMKNAFIDAESALGHVAQLLFLRRDSLSAGCDYTVTVYADGSGYAKSCKYRKATVRAEATVHAVSGTKVKLASVAFCRDQMWPGEVCGDNVTTSGVAARKAYILRRLGTCGDCPVIFRNVSDRSVAEPGERALWERFAENCKEMEVI